MLTSLTWPTLVLSPLEGKMRELFFFKKNLFTHPESTNVVEQACAGRLQQCVTGQGRLTCKLFVRVRA